jgi:hypothetical protein
MISLALNTLFSLFTEQHKKSKFKWRPPFGTALIEGRRYVEGKSEVKGKVEVQ